METHEVTLRWEQGDNADEGRPRRYVDVVVSQMERAAFGLHSGHIWIEKDGVVVKEWVNGERVDR